MIRIRTCASIVSASLPGILVWGSLLGVTSRAAADGYGEGRIVDAADRCAAFGPGFIDLGHGTCGRVHVRVDGTRNAASDALGGGSTSRAALRSDGLIGGTPEASHVRVRGNIDPYSAFR